MKVKLDELLQRELSPDVSPHFVCDKAASGL
jgi:hypothetical protein